MKCPRCGLIVTDRVPQCRGCGFSLQDLERRLRQVPSRAGFVDDFARLLSPEENASLEHRLSQFRQRLGGELVLVTIQSAKPIKPSEYVFWLFDRWQVGGDAHAGLMVLLAEKERRIECEVGYGWEPIVSDIESGRVLDDHVLPLLKQGRVYDALGESAERLATIIEQALPPEPGHPEEPSSGGGEP